MLDQKVVKTNVCYRKTSWNKISPTWTDLAYVSMVNIHVYKSHLLKNSLLKTLQNAWIFDAKKKVSDKKKLNEGLLIFRDNTLISTEWS